MTAEVNKSTRPGLTKHTWEIPISRLYVSLCFQVRGRSILSSLVFTTDRTRTPNTQLYSCSTALLHINYGCVSQQATTYTQPYRCTPGAPSAMPSAYLGLVR